MFSKEYLPSPDLCRLRNSIVQISIIIPVINEFDQVRPAVDRAWHSSANEVVIVDGGSTDGTFALASELNCLLVTSPPGRAVQMNRGAAAASGEVLVFLHVDNWLAVAACDQIRSALTESPQQFGAFRQSIQNDRMIYRWIESGNIFRVNWQGLIYGDQAFFIRREVFGTLGGFPELELMEDFAFSRVLRQIGNPVLLDGPTYVNPRRWEKNGPVRQTITNWFLSTAFRFGASPAWLAQRYHRHDQ